MAESLHLVMDQWIQYKLGKQYLLKENYTTLGIEPRTYSYPGRSGNHYSVSWVKQIYDFYSYFFFVLLFT